MHLVLGLFISQGICGVCMFEWAWKRSERVRRADEAMMDEFPSYRRLDTHLWSRAKFYPGCFLILVPRAIWVIFWFLVFGFWQWLIFFGQQMDEPLSGWRRTAQKWLFWTHCPLVILGYGYYLVHTKHGEEEIDYSRYLGPDWRKNKFQGKRVSTLISNHQGFLEILIWLSLMTPPAFIAGIHVKKMSSIADFYIKSLNSLYLDRSLPKEELDKTVDQIG